MYAWMIGRVVRSRFAAMSRRDSDAVLRYFAEDARFRYGGRHELAGDYRSKAEIASWFARLWELFRVEFVVHDVVVAGPPWNMRLATRFTARVATADGRCFVNRGMQYARIRWGRVREDHIYPDTQVVAEALEHATNCQPQSSAAAATPGQA
jgi:ketosteroid isomerase-like protein